MNRNVTILIIILMILLLAGYLLMLRNRFQEPLKTENVNPVVEEKISITPTPITGASASSSSAVASPSGKINPTAKPVNNSTRSGSTAR